MAMNRILLDFERHHQRLEVSHAIDFKDFRNLLFPIARIKIMSEASGWFSLKAHFVSFGLVPRTSWKSFANIFKVSRGKKDEVFITMPMRIRNLHG